ncbi:hypothetical protein TNCV_3570731 [Trichonephila clavipes]|nr:hypothetical protein TNCV_3570731 [Trichonephila clavipes]
MKEKNDPIQRENNILKTKEQEWKTKEQEWKTKENELNSKVQDLALLMILIPAKMNSPDYDDFIDMFSEPTPVLPLPPTPVASPSHEPSQDAIYDSLPPWNNLRFPSHL